MSSPTPPAGDPTPQRGVDPAQLTQQLKAANRIDLGLVVAGFLGLIWSWLPYYTVSAGGFGMGASASGSAWNGFFGWFAALLGLVAAGMVAWSILGRALPFDLRLVTLILFGVSFLFIFLALFITPGSGGIPSGMGDMVDYGRSVGYWLALITALAALAGSGYRFAQHRGLIGG